jgi:uncharacterized protein (TIGR02996 family)
MSADASVSGMRNAILTAPNDVLAWNAYADWLEENGFDGPGANVRTVATRITENESIIRRHFALHASREGADGPHTAFCDTLFAAQRTAIASAIEDLVYEHSFDLTESEEVISAMTITNAVNYSVDLAQVTDIRFGIDDESDAWRIVARFEYEVAGDQLEDHMWAGTTVTGAATALIGEAGTVLFDEISAEVYYDGEEHGEDDEAMFGDEG